MLQFELHIYSWVIWFQNIFVMDNWWLPSTVIIKSNFDKSGPRKSTIYRNSKSNFEVKLHSVVTQKFCHKKKRRAIYNIILFCTSTFFEIQNGLRIRSLWHWQNTPKIQKNNNKNFFFFNQMIIFLQSFLKPLGSSIHFFKIKNILLFKIKKVTLFFG